MCNIVEKPTYYQPRRHGYVSKTFDDYYKALDFAYHNDFEEILCFDGDMKYLYTRDTQGSVEELL